MGIFNDGISANQGYTDTVRSAATRNLRDYLLEYGCFVTLIGHSQGGAVIADALRATNGDCQDLVIVRTFGSPAVNWPQNVNNAVHCYFMLDAVASISRFTSADARMISSLSARIDYEHGFDSYLVHARECGMP